MDTSAAVALEVDTSPDQWKRGKDCKHLTTIRNSRSSGLVSVTLICRTQNGYASFGGAKIAYKRYKLIDSGDDPKEVFPLSIESHSSLIGSLKVEEIKTSISFKDEINPSGSMEHLACSYRLDVPDV